MPYRSVASTVSGSSSTKRARDRADAKGKRVGTGITVYLEQVATVDLFLKVLIS